MSTSRITSTFQKKLPKYMGRIGAVAAFGGAFFAGEIVCGVDQGWGSQYKYTTTDKITHAAAAFFLFAPLGYAAGFFGGKGIVKICDLAAKTGIPQAAAETTVKFIKKL